MQQLPFKLRYELTRRQRLLPHLKIWRHHALLVILCVIGAGAAVQHSRWFVGLLLFFLFIFRGFFLGMLNVLLVRKQVMDIVVEEKGLGYLAGKERWYFFLDGLIAFSQLATGVWTVQHWNGSVVNIPAALLKDEQVEFFRNWVTKRMRSGAGWASATRLLHNQTLQWTGPASGVLVN